MVINLTEAYKLILIPLVLLLTAILDPHTYSDFMYVVGILLGIIALIDVFVSFLYFVMHIVATFRKNTNKRKHVFVKFLKYISFE